MTQNQNINCCNKKNKKHTHTTLPIIPANKYLYCGFSDLHHFFFLLIRKIACQNTFESVFYKENLKKASLIILNGKCKVPQWLNIDRHESKGIRDNI